jgi:anionic cell wall polymer biosynthesis LytR-Cps2A-Psr (LCP) family protein
MSCKCVSCSNPLLFSMLMGKKVSKFLSSTNGSVTIPTISDSTMTSLTLNFVIGKYGSQNVKYIDRVTYSYSSNGGNVRTLMINFFDSDTIKQEITSTSFFPQIPRDMFYPIHLTK